MKEPKSKRGSHLAKEKLDLSPPSKAKTETLIKSEHNDKSERTAQLYQQLLVQMASPASRTHAEMLKDKRLVVLNDEDSFVGASGEVVFACQESDGKSKRVALKSTHIIQPNQLTDTCYRELLIHLTLSDLKHNNRCHNYVELIDWFKTKGWPAEEDDEDTEDVTLITHTEKTIHQDSTSNLVFRVAESGTGCGHKGLKKRTYHARKRRRLLGNRRYCPLQDLVDDDDQDEQNTTSNDDCEPCVPPDDDDETCYDFVELTTIDTNLYSTSRDEESDYDSQEPIISMSSSASSSGEAEEEEEEEKKQHHHHHHRRRRRSFKHVRSLKQQYMNLVLERADVTLNDHLRAMQNQIDLTHYKCLLFQILFSLHIAQRDYEFVHNDLHLGNIMMKHLSLPSHVTHLAFTFEEKCWLCPVEHFPYMVKLADFGLSRLKLPHNGEVVYNLRYPYHSSFLPFKDKVKIAQSLATRVKIMWGQYGEDQKAYYRDFRKKMSREDLFTPTELMCHPFFQSMIYNPDQVEIEWEKNLEYTFGDVKIFEYLNKRHKKKHRHHKKHRKEETVIDPHQELIAASDVSPSKRVQPTRRVKQNQDDQPLLVSTFTVVE
jgi:serine/threonine protein kinase